MCEAASASALASVPFIAEAQRLGAATGAVALLGVGLAGTSMVPLALLTDAVADQQRRLGLRQAGLVVGAANAVEGVSASLGAGLYAVLLGAFGFAASVPGGDVTQTFGAQVGIVAGVAVVAVVALAAVNVVLWRADPGRADPSTYATTP